MVFLIHELRDWASVLMSQNVTGCWGTKTFGAWTMCDHSEVSGNVLAFAWLAGPFISYLILWIGYGIIESRKSVSLRSVGFSLMFATLPLKQILAAIRGNSDETNAVREFFQTPDGSNHRTVAIGGLLLVLLLTVPPLIKAFKITNGLKDRLLIIPLFLLMPVIIDYLVVSVIMRKFLSNDIMQEESMPGTPFLVLLWGLFCLIFFLFTYKSLLTLFKKGEHRHRKRRSRSRTSVSNNDEESATMDSME